MAGDRKELMKIFADFSTIGMTMVFSIFIGIGIGYLLDHKLFGGKTAPWFTLVFLGIGVFAAFKNLYLLSKRKGL
jgi:ATP synthase protein I